MRLNHIKICDTIAKIYWLDYYKKWKFFYFNKKTEDFRNEIWFIEQIPAGKYLKTIYVKFFDFEAWEDRNKTIEKKIGELYQDQRKWQPVERCFASQKWNILF